MAATTTTRSRRLGVDAGQEHYKWWALSHEPGHAHGDDQLGHAHHRPARPRAGAGHVDPRARVGDPGLHDRLDRAGAHGRAPVGPLRAQDRYVAGFAVFAAASPGAGFAGGIANMHTALWVLAATSLVGAGVSILRPTS